MRESKVSSKNPIQEIVDDGLMSLGMDNVESLSCSLISPPNPDKRDSFEISEDYSHIKVRISDTEDKDRLTDLTQTRSFGRRLTN